MKVILLKDVPNVGQKHQVKTVKDGFALNMLIPKGLAKIATEGTVKNLENIRSREIEIRQATQSEIEKRVSDLEEIKLQAKANEKGHLFGGISKEDISKKTGIPEGNILLEHHLKEIGDHEVEVTVGEKKLKMKVSVEGIK